MIIQNVLVYVFKEKKVIDQLLTNALHGINLRIINVPVINEKGEMIGTFDSQSRGIEIYISIPYFLSSLIWNICNMKR